MKVVFSIDVFLSEADGSAPDSDRMERVSEHDEEVAKRVSEDTNWRYCLFTLSLSLPPLPLSPSWSKSPRHSA